jgi:hypothetical protein
MSDEIPFFAVGNEELAQAPRVSAGDLVTCGWGGSHAIEAATQDGKPSDVLMFVRCAGKTYLAAVDGRLLAGRTLTEPRHV